jgi:DNA polymerase III epsilon subunit family exonuclease
VSYEDFTAVDVETTGLDPQNGRVIELVALRYRGGQIVAEFDTLVSPGDVLVSPEAAAINLITPAMLRGKPLFGAIGKDFLDFVGSDLIVAHNIDFDVEFIRQELIRNSLATDWRPPGRCTMRAGRARFPGHGSLKALATKLNIPIPDVLHRAKVDTQLCGACWIALGKKEDPEVSSLFRDSGSAASPPLVADRENELKRAAPATLDRLKILPLTNVETAAHQKFTSAFAKKSLWIAPTEAT